jgi:hypothetical protein
MRPGPVATAFGLAFAALLGQGGVAPLVPPAAAQRAAAPPAAALPAPDRRGALTLVTENDAYALRETDRWYTNGLSLAWLSAEESLPSPLAALDAGLARIFGPARSRWGLALSQTFFTPVDKRADPPDPRDRPYAGRLFLDLGLDRRTANRLDHFGLQLGLVGPGAFGEEAQDLTHRILGERTARGWGSQLRTEPTINLFWDRTWRMPVLDAAGPGGAGGRLAADLLPTATLALGTAQIHAGLGARLRVGQGLEADFGPPRLRPAIGVRSAPPPLGDGFGWYVFAGAGGRVVGRDIALNGTLWRDGPSVDQRPLVGEVELGAAVFWRGARLSFTHVWRSKEFVAQPKPFQFGSIALTVAF